jgi:hypothetical protein
MSDELARLSARAAERGNVFALSSGAAESRPALASSTGAPGLDYQLRAGVLRGAGTMEPVAIPPGTALVHFRLPLPEAAFPTYRAAVFGEDGTELWAVARLVADATSGVRALRVIAPMELLPPGDYEVRVSGVAVDGRLKPVAIYPFRRPS